MKDPVTGRHTFRDVDLTDDQVEKDKEFTTMYKTLWMRWMMCFHDLPKEFQRHCQFMYYYGDRIVEMYLTTMMILRFVGRYLGSAPRAGLMKV